MTGNYFECGNEVIVEGFSLGRFSSFNVSNSRDVIGATAEIKIPLYTISVTDKQRPVADSLRIGVDGAQLATGARIEVYVWYKDNTTLQYTFPKILAFSGFIRKVVSGFPTTIKCEDNSFILKFGQVNKSWSKMTPLKEVMNEVVPIANDAFAKFRKEAGLTGEFPSLSVAESESADVEFTLNVWKAIAPYEAISRFAEEYVLYGQVSNTGKVYVGTGATNTDRPTIKLSTRLNVINRDITPEDGLFTDYYVEINGYDEKGNKIQVTRGDETKGEPVRLPFSPARKQEQLETIADAALARLKGNRNKGSITTLLYPFVSLWDFIEYEDTLFPELSSNYYVIGTELNCDDSGYHNILSVTDEMFYYEKA